jgi:hypothetical protein
LVAFGQNDLIYHQQIIRSYNFDTNLKNIASNFDHTIISILVFESNQFNLSFNKLCKHRFVSCWTKRFNTLTVRLRSYVHHLSHLGHTFQRFCQLWTNVILRTTKCFKSNLLNHKSFETWLDFVIFLDKIENFTGKPTFDSNEFQNWMQS